MPRFSEQELKDIEEQTKKAEAEREERRQELENNKKLKELKKKRALQEKFVAPVLLVLTILATLILKLFFGR